MLFRSDSPGSKHVSVLGILVPPRAARWFARVWISAVIVGSLVPSSVRVYLNANQGRHAHAHSRNTVSMRHRFIHLFAFGSSFFLLSLLATSRREEVEAAGEVMAVGCLVELTQYFLYPYRHVFEWWDVRDDAIGIAVTFLFIQIASRVSRGAGSRS
jgi:hypothetical protein